MYKQCKTNQSIERQRHIALKLIELMKKKPYAKISVSELCRECYISRNVFYKYYDSIRAVFDFVGDEIVLELEKYVSERARKNVFAEEAECVFQYWYEQREILGLVIENHLMEILFARIIQNAHEHQIGIGRKPAEMPEEYFSLAVDFALYGIASMLIKWHQEQYQTSPERMAEALLYLLTNPMFQTEKR